MQHTNAGTPTKEGRKEGKQAGRKTVSKTLERTGERERESEREHCEDISVQLDCISGSWHSLRGTFATTKAYMLLSFLIYLPPSLYYHRANVLSCLSTPSALTRLLHIQHFIKANQSIQSVRCSRFLPTSALIAESSTGKQ